MKILKKQLGVVLLALAFGETIHADDTPQVPVDVSLTQYVDLVLSRLEKETLSIAFPENSFELSSGQQASIDAVVPKIKMDSNVTRLVVVSWADRWYPVTNEDQLSDFDRRLIDKRNEAIQKYLNKKGLDNVDVFVPTEKPEWLVRFLQTDNSQFKGDNARIAAVTKERLFRFLETKGGPSKAVILIKRDWKHTGKNS